MMNRIRQMWKKCHRSIKRLGESLCEQLTIILGVATAFFVFVFVGVVLFYPADGGVPPANVNALKMLLGTKDKAEHLRFIGGVIGMLLVALNAVMLYRRIVAIEAGNIQDRFKAAIEHLESERDVVRMAAFREFYYLARDNRALRADVWDLLSEHFVRITSDGRHPPYEPASMGYYSTGARDLYPNHEVQKLADILFRPVGNRWIFARHARDTPPLNLIDSNLQYLNLTHARIQAHFPSERLDGVKWEHSQLGKSRFDPLVFRALKGIIEKCLVPISVDDE